ncbi:MAG TPA: hypothetical protein VGL65_09865 [Gemmatimonadales bacterium]|jgi:hypothetical protein
MPGYRFGKHPPKSDYRTLRFQDYLSPRLAAPPPSHNVLATVYASLGTTDPTRVFPLDGNDTLGDCTIAAVAHACTTYQALIGRKTIMARGDVVKLYLRLTGGLDTGLSELDVLNYWRKHPVAGDEIMAFAAINPRNHTHVKQAIALFGGVYLGFQVQQDCIADFAARKAWTPGPLTPNGHAVFAAGYTRDTVMVLTWGNTQLATWAWWDECVDEAYAILPPEAKDPAFAPGFSVAALTDDLHAVAS